MNVLDRRIRRYSGDGRSTADTFATPASPRYSSYIEAACLEVRGLVHVEDCYELRLLRLFEEEYVARLPNGSALIFEQESRASGVTQRIARLGPEEAREAYLWIYERAVAPVVELILRGRWEKAHALQVERRREIESRFLEPKDRR